MILFDLKCGKGHVFEAWFRDGATADKQLSGRKVSCPDCGSAKVAKAPMAPRIGKGRSSAAGDGAEAKSEPPQDTAAPAGAVMTKEMASKAAQLRKELTELRAKVEANCDYVGGRFAEEARKIHYGETEARGIYGETSDHEARELVDEGIEFSRIPWLPQRDS
jgi:hypothetical protein